MLLSDKLKLAIREVEYIDLLSESKRYTEEELLDIMLDNPDMEKRLAQDLEYAEIIERFKEGGLI